MTESRTQDQFLAAYNDIENHLKSVLYGGKDGGHPGFAKMLNEHGKKHPRRLTRAQRDALEALADVRNLMSHSRYFDGRLPVDPTPAAVRAIEGIRDHLISPATVLGVLGQRDLVSVSPSDSVRQVLHVMHENDFSQVPVYQDATYVGLLTNNAIARWVAAEMEVHDGLAEDAPVAEVLAFAEPADRVEHLPRNLTAADAVAVFAEAAESGMPVAALLISQNGKPTERPLTIVVPADLSLLAGAEPR